MNQNAAPFIATLTQYIIITNEMELLWEGTTEEGSALQTRVSHHSPTHQAAAKCISSALQLY